MSTATATASAPLLPYAIARAFKPKEVFGEPKRILRNMPTNSEGDTIDGHYFAMGHIFGKADAVKLSQRENRDGNIERSYGLQGTFEAIPTNREKNPIRTSVAWLPTHIHDAIAAMLRDNDPVNGEVNEGGADSLEMAFEVGIKSNSKSSTGFTWEYKPLMELRSNSDPLEHLRKHLPAGVMPIALPGVADKAPEAEAPEGTDRGDEPSETEEAQSGNAAANGPKAAPKAGKGHK